MKTAEITGIILLLGILILLLWNIIEFRQLKKPDSNQSDFWELKAKLNFIMAIGSLFIFVLAYFGFNVKDEIMKKSKPLIQSAVSEIRHEVDSLIDNKNILKAGIYIVSDINFMKDSVYKFESLRTIDNKNLPIFNHAPKLIINTNTGESLRIKTINTSEFTIEKTPNYGITFRAPNNNIRFDIWIADYKNPN